MASLPPARPSGISLVFIDDNAFIFRDGKLRTHRGDFYRFAAKLGGAASGVTLCSPVMGLPRHHRRSHAQQLSIEGNVVIPTFPYLRLSHYIIKLPLALMQNIPALTRAIRGSDLVIIRVPAANAILAFIITRLLKKPIALFLVGPPAAGALTKRHPSALRFGILLAARAEWMSISWIARHAATFAYGSHLAEHLRIRGVRDVSVTFTSLIDRVAAKVDRSSGQVCPSILFVGRFAPEKGIDLLLQAMQMLLVEGMSFRLDLVGSGPLEADLRSQAQLADINVVFHGWLPDGPELAQALAGADLLVQPSRQEGIPKVLLLAMAHSLPIVATRVGGIPDIITNEVNGLLVPPEDPSCIAEAIRRLLTDSALRQQISAGAWDFADEHTAQKQISTIWRCIKSTFPDLSDKDSED